MRNCVAQILHEKWCGIHGVYGIVYGNDVNLFDVWCKGLSGKLEHFKVFYMTHM